MQSTVLSKLDLTVDPDPRDLLDQLYQRHPETAIFLALTWADPDNPRSLEHFNAAWEFSQEQTHFGLCDICRWPKLHNLVHLECLSPAARQRAIESEELIAIYGREE